MYINQWGHVWQGCQERQGYDTAKRHPLHVGIRDT